MEKILLLVCGLFLVACAQIDAYSSTCETGSGAGGGTTSQGGSGGSVTTGGSGGEQVHKSLKVMLSDSPYNQPRNVLGESVTTSVVYRIQNDSDIPVSMKEYRLSQADPGGKEADFDYVGFGWDCSDDMLYCTTPVLPDQFGDKGYVGGDGLPTQFEIEPGESNELFIRGIMAAVQPTSVPGVSVARSGDTPALLLDTFTVYEDVPVEFIGSLQGPSHVLRKSEPLVTPLPLPQPGLAEGSQPLFAWNIDTASANPVSLVAYVLDIESYGLQICDFRLEKDGVELPHEMPGAAFSVMQYTYNEIYGNNYIVGDYCMTSGSVQIKFGEVEQIYSLGAGSTYRLKATIQGIQDNGGTHIKTSFHRTDVLTTAAFTCNGGPPVIGLGLDWDTQHALIWSDLSEGDAHKPCWEATDPNMTSSKDYIGDALVKDLDFVQVRSN